MKVIAGPWAQDADARRRFEREARLAASLEHPHIVAVHDAGEADGVAFVVMRFVPGPDLRQVLAGGPLEPERAVRLLAGVAAALDAAHGAGLVHRDVKPANVLVAEGDHVLLTDFGLARLAAGGASATGAGVWVGTPDYSAPEQVRGEPVSAAADVYALGCVLFQMLTGTVPFPRASHAARAWAHEHAAVPPCGVAGFDAVLARALAKAPGDRFASAGELARAADAAIDAGAGAAGVVRIASTRLVGRDAELAALDAAVQRARNGRPGLMLVAGEAGVGKSRLLREAARAARADGVLAFRGACLDLGDGDLPYAPIAAAVRELADGPHAGVLDGLPAPARQELARAFPELATDAGGEPAREAGRFAQGRLFELLLTLLRRLSERTPLLLVVEDVHWADPSTREFIAFFVRHARAERVALVATFRTDEVHREHPLRALLAGLARNERTRRVELRRLTRGQVGDQLEGILGHPPEPALADDLFARSQGNPFYVEELLDARRAGEDLPDSLRDALLLHVDALSEPARDTLRLAAVVARPVGDALLAGAGDLAGRELHRALREAVARHILVEAPGGLAFRHALVREAVYADLLPGERGDLHAAVARALAGAEAPNPAELARHWLAAGDRERAHAASIEAGRTAAAAHAPGDALAHFERAIELGPAPEPTLLADAAEAARLSGAPDRAAELCRRAIDALGPDADPAQAARLHERLGRYLAWDPERALASYATALALLPAAPTAARARLLGDEALALMYLGRHDDARERSRFAVAAAEAAGARAEEAYARSTLGFVLAFLGRPEPGERELRHALALATDAGRVEDVGRAYVALAEVLRYRGRLDDALAVTEQGRATARRLGVDGSFGVFFAVNAAEDCFHLGRWDEAQRRLQEVDPVRLEPTGRLLRESVAGRLAVARGDGPAARAHLDEGRRLSDAGHTVEQIPSLYAGLAELALWEGRATDARHLVTEALDRVGDRIDALNGAVLFSLGARADPVGPWLEPLESLLGDDGACPPQARAHRALTAAERARTDPARWAAAAGAWDAVAHPYPAAYARLRLGTPDALEAAHATAIALRAAPLRRAVEQLIDFTQPDVPR